MEKPRVVLVGGGHAHALVIQAWEARHRDTCDLILVSQHARTPYSGMVPGLVAGHYSEDQVHIDLARLCEKRGVRFIQDELVALDLQSNTVVTASGNDVPYDRLSLNTGSQSNLSTEGARECSIPIKPISTFQKRFLNKGRESAQARIHAVVGGGASGFEIAMALAHSLRGSEAEVDWYIRGAEPLSQRSPRTRARALKAAKRAGVRTHCGVHIKALRPGELIGDGDRTFKADSIIWCAGAAPPGWPRQSDLATDSRGFVLTNACLQSVSHPDVFAAGDIGTQAENPCAKAGVFAVRQAPILHKNILASVQGETLAAFEPQANFLSLLATGKRSAIADKWGLSIEGAWVWRWKDRIDQRFMSQFR